MDDPSLPEDPSFREALEFMGDPDRLLPGEEPGTQYVDDAHHWLNVYAELLRFKDELLATVQRAGEGARHASQPEVNADLALMEAERSRLATRTQYWRDRLRHLGSAKTRAKPG